MAFTDPETCWPSRYSFMLFFYAFIHNMLYNIFNYLSVAEKLLIFAKKERG